MPLSPHLRVQTTSQFIDFLLHFHYRFLISGSLVMSVNQEDHFLQKLKWVTIAIITILAVIQFLPWLQHTLTGSSTEPRTVTARGDLAADEQSTVTLFEQSSPSVIYISIKERVRDPFSRDILSVPRGTGSGFIWDDKGHVITNNHVIEGADEAIVHLNDGRTYKAKLVGRSPQHDLAVLRINVPFDRPPPVPVGSSADLKVGQKVFAIGNPFGLDYTLTSGIISALNRSLDKDIRIDNLIQTDAAINPGNSGGPLLDSAGRLIGINTAIYSPSGAYAGIGFAVPVDTVNRVVPQLIDNGRYVRPTIGISIDEDINRIVTEELDVEGVLVIKTLPGSSAEKVGLRNTEVDARGNVIPGDVILAVNGKKIKDVTGLLTQLDAYNIGDTVTLAIWRRGKNSEVTVELQGGVK
jgi:S1-C subfamily serine protease